jgi:predicted amidohydrolase YtcJ
VVVNVVGRAARHGFRPLALPFWVEVPHVIVTASIPAVPSPLSIRVSHEPLAGDCLFPGFIEPHCHLLLSALIGPFFVDLDPLTLKSNKQSDAISALKNATPSGGWITGYGYDPARMEDHADLSMGVLDGVSKTTPILVINASGHIGYANSLAFSIAGITKTTPNPTGGTFVKDRAGNLTGVLLEVPAMAPFEAHLTPPPAREFVQFAHQTLQKWSEAGCTTVFDAGIGLISPGTDVDVRLLDAVTSKVPPVVRYTGAFTTATAIAVGAGVPPYQVNKDFLVRSIKVWADGSTQGFTAALREPYADSKGWGNLSLSDGEIRDTMAIWQKKGWQLLVHSNGDRSTDQALGAYDAILNHEPDPNPHIMHRIEHATVISLQQLRAAKFLNLGVSHLIGHVRYWGDAFRSWVLKDERAERIDPVKDDVDLGIVYSFHSDSPVSPVQPLMYACIAATRTMYQRPDTDVLGRDQRCSVIEALRGITTNAAKHVMLEDLIGSLESGKSADMVRLDQDPTMITDDHAADLGGIRVLETWLKGKMVYRRDTTTPQGAEIDRSATETPIL